MNTKYKVLSTILFLALATILSFVGVWALTNLDFTVGGDITYTAPKPKVNLLQDANGFYVAMGHTDTISEIKWRLVGLDGNKFSGTTSPTSGTGTFILETYVAKHKEFNVDYDAGNDYATSDIRAYLNGDYITYLNLANDVTYNAIAERSVVDMYIDIGWNVYKGNSNYAENAVYSITTVNAESDKLWLMSVAEVYTLLGGGAISNGIIDPYSWGAGLGWDDQYWLRSPIPGDTYTGLYVYGAGAWSQDDVDVTYLAVRPAFNLELG